MFEKSMMVHALPVINFVTNKLLQMHLVTNIWIIPSLCHVFSFWFWNFDQISKKLNEFIQVSNTQLEKKLGFWWLTIFFNLLSKFSKYWIKKTPTLLNFPTFCNLFSRFMCMCITIFFNFVVLRVWGILPSFYQC